MDNIESAVQKALALDKVRLEPSTFYNREISFKQLTRFANVHVFPEISQALFDAFIKDDHGSKERHTCHVRVAKEIDAVCHAGLKDEYGSPYTEDSYPSIEVTKAYLKDLNFPVETVPAKYLIVYSEALLRPLNNSKSTIGQYKHSWTDFRKYCEDHYEGKYCKESLNEYLSLNDQLLESKQRMTWKWKINRKAVLVLQQVAMTGEYHWMIQRTLDLAVEGDLEEVRQEFLQQIKTSNLSRKYLYLNDYVLRNMFRLARIQTVDDLKTLSPEKVQSIIIEFSKICSNSSMETICPLIKTVLKFLFTNQYCERDYSCAVLKSIHKYENATPYLNIGDSKKVLDQIENESLRDKAMILVAMRLAIRNSDICSLKLENIDWDNEQINITQQKTKEPLVLPLLPEVGNAIYDYIINERPSGNSPYVFLRKQAPYTKLSSAYGVFSRVLKKAGVVPENRCTYGSHLFRYTVVHALLEAKVPHQVITDTLGHTSAEADKPYLSMEESMLKMCAIDCSEIGIITWKAAI